MNQIWTILDVLSWTTEYFKSKKITNPRLDAELIISYVLKIKRLDIYLKFDQPLISSEKSKIREYVKRRGQREPLQYIIGEIDFYNCKIKVNRNVLIPRPETEYMVDIIIKENFKPRKILDLCTGSGAIAISLKKELIDVNVKASDISENALELAKKNAIINKSDIQFIHSDLFEDIHEKFDLIVSNPPYVDENIYKTLEPEIFFEPKLALVSSDNGLGFYKRILQNTPKYLSSKGILYLEIGDEQALVIEKFAKAFGYVNIEIIKDLTNKDRIIRMELDQ
jgi:release factor glutamine methyltransferase